MRNSATAISTESRDHYYTPRKVNVYDIFGVANLRAHGRCTVVKSSTVVFVFLGGRFLFTC